MSIADAPCASRPVAVQPPEPPSPSSSHRFFPASGVSEEDPWASPSPPDEELPAPGAPSLLCDEAIARQRAEERAALLQQLHAMAPEALADERLLYQLAVSSTATLTPVDEAMAVLASLLLSDAESNTPLLLKRLEAIKKMTAISHTLQLRIQAAFDAAQTLRLRRSSLPTGGR